MATQTTLYSRFFSLTSWDKKSNVKGYKEVRRSLIFFKIVISKTEVWRSGRFISDMMDEVKFIERHGPKALREEMAKIS